MSFIGSLSSFGQSASDKMKDTAEMVRISGNVTDLKKQLSQIYEEIGRYLCTMEPAQYQDAVTALVQRGRACQLQLEQLEQQMETLKGKTRCPQCGTVLKTGVLFCSTCGYHFPVQAQNVCAGCGNVLQSDQQFCIFCGRPVPPPAAAPIPTTPAAGTQICRNCGKTIGVDQTFCRFCGTRLQ